MICRELRSEYNRAYAFIFRANLSRRYPAWENHFDYPENLLEVRVKFVELLNLERWENEEEKGGR